MKFNIGDIVSEVDGVLNGEIISLTSYKAIVVDKEGFDYEIALNKLVNKSLVEAYENTFNQIPIEKEIKKIIPNSKKSISRKIKEIDLHMDTLSESSRGMTNHDIVVYQLNAVEKAFRETDKRYFSKLVFIHGIGKGKLRYELERVLKTKGISFQDASFKKYGRGAIEVLL